MRTIALFDAVAKTYFASWAMYATWLHSFWLARTSGAGPVLLHMIFVARPVTHCCSLHDSCTVHAMHGGWLVLHGVWQLLAH